MNSFNKIADSSLLGLKKECPLKLINYHNDNYHYHLHHDADHVNNKKNNNNHNHQHHHEHQKEFRFEPPLYLQRYDLVRSILEKYGCKTLLDIGSSECKLLKYLKNTKKDLNLMIGLDIDEELLKSSVEKFPKTWCDHMESRETPLDIYLIKGDISKASDYFIKVN
jgi:hypothetical protein